MWFKSRVTIKACVAISFCLIGGTTHAAADILHVPGDFPTIQSAIVLAMDGDEVVVAEVALVVVISGQRSHAQPPNGFLSYQKISSNQGGGDQPLDNDDQFTLSVASLGDLEGDGIGDLARVVSWDNYGSLNYGVVWLLCLNTDVSANYYEKFNAPVRWADRGRCLSEPVNYQAPALGQQRRL